LLKRRIALIVAAGTGSRLGAGIPKALVLAKDDIPESSLVAICCRTFKDSNLFDRIVVVYHPGSVLDFSRALSTIDYQFDLCPGGETRQASVRAGVRFLEQGGLSGETIVAVHDAARALVTIDILERVVLAAEAQGAASVALPVADALVRVRENGEFSDPVDRQGVFSVQTPQAFSLSDLSLAHEEAYKNSIIALDDAGLVGLHRPVVPVMGDPVNFKVTTAADLSLLREIYVSRATFE
jgi:2-C-methyl-D-erythritol 4-phosphate cytidylyltransferase